MGDSDGNAAHAAPLDETIVATPSHVTSSGTMAASSFTPGSGERQVLAQRYEILALLGSGGMGTVYRARDLELEEMVALKVLRRELVDAPGILDRFRREVKLARRVTHQNVARVFDIGEHQGEKFLTMELVEGEPLSAVIAREGAISVPRAAGIAAAIADGLASAHAAGVIHRDLKPDNVLMSQAGRVVITDFGIARGGPAMGNAANTMGGLIGTPAYMAPEQVEGRADIDARADIYAFGALLYELFTGARAWPGDSPFAVASARLVSPPPDPRGKKPGLSAAAADLVLRCLARKPEERPSSMTMIAAELTSLAASASVTLTPAKPIAPIAATIATPTPAPAETGKTVAVLPFRNAGAADDDYLSEELTDDLIDALSMTRGLKVRSRGTVARYRGKDQDPREIGRELAVQVVVEGSVRKARGSVRVSARLVSVSDGFQLWAKRFDRPEQDVLSINDEVARSIAEALTLDAAAARAAPHDPAAIDLYIRARHEYRKFWPEHVEKSVGLFRQAHAIGPNDPMILSGLALALTRAAFFGGEGHFVEARRFAEQAVAAAPDLGEAQLALGSVHFQTGEHAAAARTLRRAVMLSPGFAEAHGALGRMLTEAGAVDEGLRRFEAALALEPELPNVRQDLGRAYALLGRMDEAEAQFEKLRTTNDMYAFWTMRARIAMWHGEGEQAQRYLQELSDNGVAMQIPRLLLDLQTGKMPPDAVAVALEEMAGPRFNGSRRRAFFLQLRAEVFAGLRDAPRALDSMEKSAEAGLIDRLWLERCPIFDFLRAEPRYLAVHAEISRRTDTILAAYRSA